MGDTKTKNATDTPRSALGLPLSIWLIAVGAAVLHLAPFVHAWLQTPAGWHFTGIIQDSPDFIQYRAWLRQSQFEGPVVSDSLTSESSRPHLPVPLFWLVGKLGSWFHIYPELVYTCLGAPLALGLVLALYLTARYFLSSSREAFWATLFMILGGGFGAYIKLLLRFAPLRDNFLVKSLFKDAFWGSSTTLVWEDYRWHYVIQTLFDTHYLVVWLFTTGAVMALWFAVLRPSLRRIICACSIFALLTFLHVHEAVVLSVVSAVMIFVLKSKHLLTRGRLAALIAPPAAGILCLALLLELQRMSGVPFPPWRAPIIPFATFMLSYPATAAILVLGAGRYWRSAELKQCFLIGWAGGCVITILSGPFYAFPDRGTATLQIPLAIITIAILFPWLSVARRTARVALIAAVTAASVITPVYTTLKFWECSNFRTDARYAYIAPEQQALASALRLASSRTDILVARESDVLWLAAEHPGRHYCAHFFLTSDYPSKHRQVLALFQSPPEQQAAFLAREGIRFLYVGAADRPQTFARVPGLTVLRAETMGTLFAFSPANAPVHSPTPDAKSAQTNDRRHKQAGHNSAGSYTRPLPESNE